MDPPKRVSRTLSLLHTFVDSPYKDAVGDEPTDPETRPKASTSVQAVKEIPQSFHFFERLPPELRNRVYELSLCRGRVFVKPVSFCGGESENQLPRRRAIHLDDDLIVEGMLGSAHDSRGRRRPRYVQLEGTEYDRSPKYMGLLQGVSKTIQEEAGQIFYGPKNHFVLPAGHYSYPKTSGHGTPNRDDNSVSSRSLPPFKSISYTFDMRDVYLDPWALREEIKRPEWESPESGDDFEKNIFITVDVKNQTHGLGKKYLMDVWKKRVWMMRSQLALKFLQIDFEECYCPTGCCRMAEDICKRLGPFESFPDKFEVIGVRNKAEAANIRRDIVNRNKVNKVHPRDIRCVDLNGQSIDYEALAPSVRPTLKIKLVRV